MISIRSVAPCIAGLVLALLPPALAAQGLRAPEPEGLLVASCETTRLEVGRPESRWALGRGVYKDESDPQGRDFAWAEPDWEVRLLLSAEGPRSLRLRGRAGPEGLTLRTFWNGVDLGERAVSRDWRTFSWPVPAEATSPGLNRLVFRGSKARERKRLLSFCLDWLEVDAGDAICSESEVEWREVSWPLALPPGGIAWLPLALPPAAAVVVELAGEAGAQAHVEVSSAGTAGERRSVSLPAGGSAIERFELGDARATELTIVNGDSTLTVQGADVTGDESWWGWRRACGQLPRKVLFVFALALLGLALAWAPARIGLPGERFAPWLDAALIFVLALAVRFWFLDGLGFLDHRRFGDAWEYLHRARGLASGQPSILGDVSWHSWGTWIRPPGFYLFLAWVLKTFAAGVQALGPLQSALGAVMAAATQLAAYPLFGRVAGLSAGALMAGYPEAVISVVWILTEPLYLVFLVPALALLAWVSVRPSAWWATLAGLSFGLAALVRSAPAYFVPLAAALLVFASGWRRARWAALGLIGGMLLVVGPWSLRNSLIYRWPVGVDNIVVVNFLHHHPDDRYVRVNDLDLSTDEGAYEYLQRLKEADRDGELTRSSGIVRRGLLRMTAHPVATLRGFAGNLGRYLDGFPYRYVPVLGVMDTCGKALWFDLLNGGYLLILVSGVLGMALAIRDRRTWPVLSWVLFNAVVINLLFAPSPMPGRFRLASMPVLAVFAGAAWARGLELFGRRRD